MYDVVIIGAGITGAMLARELSKYKLKVCVLEKENDVAMGATKANSAIVHAGFDAETGSLKAKLNVRGSALMEKIASELGVKYRRNGSLVIGFEESDREYIEKLYERGLANGVPELSVLSREELVRLEPAISPKAQCALYAPTGAIVCPYELCIAAIGNAIDNGTRLIRNFEVAAIAYENDSYRIRSTDGSDEVCARFVVNAAGLFSDKIAAMVGDESFTIHPRRGEYVLFDKTHGTGLNSTVFRTPTKMGKGILCSPTVDGNLLIGPTAEDVDDRNDKSTTGRGLNAVLSQGGENLAKGLPMGKTVTSFCGLRSVGSTGDFIIDSPKKNFINVAGIESPGLSASPAIAEYVAQMLFDFGLERVENESFNPIRRPAHFFSMLSEEEKNELIKKDGSYGKTVCRCEGITKGEIIYAIRTEPKALDVDSVKRRTRAGMGRCQGNFCTVSIMEILSEELAIPFSQVTKCGDGSNIVSDRTKVGQHE